MAVITITKENFETEVLKSAQPVLLPKKLRSPAYRYRLIYNNRPDTLKPHHSPIYVTKAYRIKPVSYTHLDVYKRQVEG